MKPIEPVAAESDSALDPAAAKSGFADAPAADDAQAYGRQMASGSLWIGLARASLIPFGIITAIFLARRLGPSDLGVYAVAASVTFLVQQTINGFLDRAAIKLIAEGSDWQAIATALIQIYGVVGTGGAVLLIASAPLLASFLNAPPLEPALRLFALMLPLMSVMLGHENTMVGRRAFRRSALVSVAAMSRPLLLLLLVGMGWGVNGAVLSQVGGALIELITLRFLIPVPLLRRVPIPARRILRYAAPFFLDTMGRQLNSRIDLWAVQAFVDSASAGYYSAAQSGVMPLRTFSQVVTPLLLASLSHAWQQGNREAARMLARQTLRLLSCLLPMVAIVAGAAPGLVTLVFGSHFLPAAPVLAWLSLGAFAGFVLSFTTVTLGALDQPGMIAAFTLPMLVVSALGSLLFVPRIGAVGAALTTALTQWGAMAASVWFLNRRTGIALDVSRFLRVVPLAVLGYGLASELPAPGIWVIAQVMTIGLLMLALLFVIGSLTRDDLAFFYSLLAHERDMLRGRARRRAESRT